MNKELTHKRVQQVLEYESSTGVFRWKVSRGCAKAGSIAGDYYPNGYKRIKVDGREYCAHRLAWFWVFGYFPIEQIDHINGIRDDNRIDNLRECTQSQNNQNKRHAQKNSKSGMLGVGISHGKYQASIKLRGRRHHLGTFATPEEAHNAYKLAKATLHPFSTIPWAMYQPQGVNT